MRGVNFILKLLFPPKCFICGKLTDSDSLGMPFCKRCTARIEFEKASLRALVGDIPSMRCSSERDLVWDGLCYFTMAYTAGDSKRACNRFILNLKNRAEKSAVRFAAGELLTALNGACPNLDASDAVVTYIPRSGEALRRNGFDHMKAVTGKLAELIGVKRIKCIGRRRSSPEQKSLSRRERKENAENTMYSVNSRKIKGKTVIIADDIITTGASVCTAAALLKRAGAARVIAVTLARTVSDDGEGLI